MILDPKVALKMKPKKSSLKRGNTSLGFSNNKYSKSRLKTFIEKKRTLLTPYTFNFFENSLLSIEIVHENSNLERIFFFKLPYFDSLTKSIKNKFNEDVNRMSCKTKCNDLLHNHEIIINEIKREAYITRFRLVSFISKKMNLLRSFVYLIVVAINILILISFQRGLPS